MEDGFSEGAVLSFIKRNLFLSSLTVIGCVLLGGGFFFLKDTGPSQESVVFEAADTDASPEKEPSQKQPIFVDIGGAVEKPGVYEVSSDARVQEVLLKAGGLAKTADHQGIAKSINLAAKLTDGMKIYFPHQGENISTQTSSEGSAIGEINSSGMININTGSQVELESLPGIGEVTATKIIKGRPYSSIDELKSKKIVGESVYGKIQDLVSVN